MKFLLKVIALLCLSLLFAALPVRVWAQAGSSGDSTPTVEPTTPPLDLPKGVVTGKITNQNDPSKPVGNLAVSLHILDKDQNEVGMLDSTTAQDGSFTIADVPFQAGMGYGAGVTYEGTTYYSQLVLAQEGKTSVNLEVLVYESTNDLSKVQVGQMHVLFDFIQDGMDVQELYVMSNLGDRTVKGAMDVPGKDGVKAVVQFPLPLNATFLNFEPKSDGRFLTFPGGFADTASLVPGQMTSQFMVRYLVPYATPLTYQLKTVLPVQALNFVLPKESGMTLKSAGLGKPEPVTAQDGQLYYLYKLVNIPAGQTLNVTLEGKPVISVSQATEAAIPTKTPSNALLFVGLGIFGIVLIGGGAFWWVRNSKRSEGDDLEGEDLEVMKDEEDQSGFDALLTQIAQLDSAFEQGEVDENTYKAQRAFLKNRAKAVMTKSETEPTEAEAFSSE